MRFCVDRHVSYVFLENSFIIIFFYAVEVKRASCWGGKVKLTGRLFDRTASIFLFFISGDYAARRPLLCSVFYACFGFVQMGLWMNPSNSRILNPPPGVHSSLLRVL